jgi:hypothetical protein
VLVVPAPIWSAEPPARTWPVAVVLNHRLTDSLAPVTSSRFSGRTNDPVPLTLKVEENASGNGPGWAWLMLWE